MAIAKRIIDAHEGAIAAGTDDGRGATILITLPRGQNDSGSRHRSNRQQALLAGVSLEGDSPDKRTRIDHEL